jgi:hypothetical protein
VFLAVHPCSNGEIAAMQIARRRQPRRPRLDLRVRSIVLTRIERDACLAANEIEDVTVLEHFASRRSAQCA